jgi:hypothetical protein
MRRGTIRSMNNLTIRFATGNDDLDRLAQLDSSVVPAAPQIVAEADGRVIAALSTRDGSAIADPFTRSAEAVALLRRRAAQLVETPHTGRRHALRLAL